MRLWFCLAALVLLTPFAGAQPIPVVRLDRKEAVDYAKEIEPILAKKCQVCHSGNVTEGQFDLGSHERLMRGGKRGPAVVPGKAADSRLVRLAGKTGKPSMPPKGDEPLTPEELALVKLWIDQGAKASDAPRERPRVTLVGLPATVRPVRALAVRADKSLVAVGRGHEIHLFEPAAGTHKGSFTDPDLTGADKKPLRAAHASVVEALAFSPDGRTLASGGFQDVILWDVQSGRPRLRLGGFADRVVALAFSADGKRLATGGGAPTEDGEVKVWDAATGNLIAEVKNGHSDTVFGVCFSPDGSKLASGGADKFVKVFEVPSGKLVKAFEGHTHHVLDVGWKADGKLLVSAGADNAIKVWDYDKGEQSRTITGHTKQVSRLAFVGTTSQFVTCGGDHLVRFWNADNGGGGVRCGGGGDFLYAVGVSPDGKLVAAGGEDGVVRVYNGGDGKLLKTLAPPVPPAPAKK
jgi:WD40 repeat protein